MRRLVLASAMLLSGCGAWRQVEVSPAALATEPAEVRVTRLDGTRIILEEPRVTPDCITGTNRGKQLAISLDSVSRLAVPSASNSQRAAGTTLVGTAIVAFGFWLAYAAVSE